MGTKRCLSDEEDPDTTNSSSFNFGCFILHVTYSPVSTRSHKHLNEQAVFMLTSASNYPEKSRSRSSSSSSSRIGDCLSTITTGSNDDDDDEQLILKVKNLGFPFPYKYKCFEKHVIGSHNGLVCLLERRPRLCPRYSPFKPFEVILWNPTTGQHRILPESLTMEGDHPCHTLGVFGFDVVTKDYKVVLFTGLHQMWNGHGSSDCFCRVQVYSLSTDSWRLLEHIPCLPGFPFLHHDENVLCFNGTCFFLAHFFWTEHQLCIPKNDRFIISFDLSKEIITPIQLPDHDRYQELCLYNWGDKVALFTSPRIFYYTPTIRTHEDFNIWLLNCEHGSINSVNKQFWTKLHSFRIQLDQIPRTSYKPRLISNDGKYVLLESPAEAEYSPAFSRRMILYNLATQELKRNFLPCRYVVSKGAYAYNPSQFSVSSSSSAVSSSSNIVSNDGKSVSFI